MTNLTRSGENHKKKSASVMTIDINLNTFEDYTSTESHLVGYLPEKAVVIDAYLVVRTAVGPGAATITLGTTDSGTEIMSAGAADTVGVSGTFTGKSDTQSGKEVYMTLSADAIEGEAYAVIEYTEYALNNGDLTLMD